MTYKIFNFSYKVLYKPTTLPISLTELKSHLKLDESDTSEDTYLTLLIGSVVHYAESYTKRDFITKKYLTYRNCFTSPFEIRRCIVQSIESIKYLVNDVLQTVDSSVYYLTDVRDDFGKVYLKENASYPSSFDDREQSIQITFNAGYGIAVSSLQRATNVVTATTTNNHYYSSGDTIVISGANETGFNGSFTITVTGDKTFTYANTGSNVTATGTIASALIPQDLKVAMLNHIARVYENRGDCPDDIKALLPSESKMIYDFYRILEITG